MNKRLQNIPVGELEEVLARSGQTLWMVAFDGRMIDMIGDLSGAIGYERDELRGRLLGEIVDPKDLRRAASVFYGAVAGKTDFEIELGVLHKDGRRLEVRVNAVSISRDGDEPYLLGLSTDIGRQTRAERALEIERSRFFRTFEQAPNGIVLLHMDRDRGGLIKGVNEEACRIAMREEDDLVGTWLIESGLIELDDFEQIEAVENRTDILERGAPSFTAERVLTRPDGSRINIKAAVSALELDGLETEEEFPVNAIVHIEDVTERKLAEHELKHQARHDPLTDLLNRRRFLALLDDRLERAESGHGGGALLMIDLDGFKSVNDSHGHFAGDGVLRQVAQMLRDELRETDPVARLGGDEFAVLLPKVDRRGAQEVTSSLLRRFESSRIDIAESDGQVFRPSISIGAILLDGRPVDAERALRDCDKAMYEAKRQGGSRYVIAAS